MFFDIHQIARTEFELRNARLARELKEGVVMQSPGSFDRLLAAVKRTLARRQARQPDARRITAISQPRQDLRPAGK